MNRLNDGTIRLRGARIHNLASVDLDIPIGKLVVVCGVSGSGKTSLALDTLYAEGQRRFIESFSSYARQFLQRIEKPDYDSLEGLPPTTCVQRPAGTLSPKLTVGSQTEAGDYVRLLMTKLGQLHCMQCNVPIIAHTPQSIAAIIGKKTKGCKIMICFPLAWESRADLSSQLAELQASGFLRIVVSKRSFHLAEDDRSLLADAVSNQGNGWVVVDRILGGSPENRTVESLDAAFDKSPLRIALLILSETESPIQSVSTDSIQEVDGKFYRVDWFGRDRRCSLCDLDHPAPEPNLFHANSPLGGCPKCDGLGYCRKGDPFPCETCKGTRLQPASLAYRMGPYNIHELGNMEIGELFHFLSTHFLDSGIPEMDRDVQQDGDLRSNKIAKELLRDLRRRLAFLKEVGLGHLSLNRFGNTLSSGELQRVSLTVAMGSSLTNMMYLLDEPTSGLHPTESIILINAIIQLRDRGNTVVAISHDRRLIDASDWAIEMGPGAGDSGGKVLYCGETSRWKEISTLTTDYLAQRRGRLMRLEHRRKPKGGVRIAGATGHNLQKLSIEFPIGVLCVVTGVSGSGKSTLVEGTLSNALRAKVCRERVEYLPLESIQGYEELNDVVLIDQNPIARNLRSIPATYMKILDEIREVFADTIEAKSRGLNAAHFSFNHESGRCEACAGTGCQSVDMQFLADIQVPCGECNGTRYRRESLEVKYRDRSIADVLSMPAENALTFFRGHPKVQHRLQSMLDVGLQYLRLGQSGNQLSQGESQRLKLASHFGATTKRGTLYLLDEPTNGLHFNDVVKLIDCFNKLLDQGHSLIVIDHHDQLLMAADHLIELGSGASREGGRLVAAGTPEQLMECPESSTGKFLLEQVTLKR